MPWTTPEPPFNPAGFPPVKGSVFGPFSSFASLASDSITHEQVLIHVNGFAHQLARHSRKVQHNIARRLARQRRRYQKVKLRNRMSDVDYTNTSGVVVIPRRYP